MAQVSDKVLAWLYSVLREYRDPDRTYSDVARTLSAYPTLSPRTDIFTAEDGSSQLLLVLLGTIPASFRGTTYHFPVKLWIPLRYAQEPPLAFVDPSRDMMVRPGQHVGSDGRIYHPYIRNWNSLAGRANIVELLAYLPQIFAKEPPVLSKAQQQYQPQQQPHPHQTHPQHPENQQYGQPNSSGSIIPPLPPKQNTYERLQVDRQTYSQVPPPRPQKGAESGSSRHIHSNRDINGPPLPPLPHERTHSESQSLSNGSHHNSRTSTGLPYAVRPGSDLRYTQQATSSHVVTSELPLRPRSTMSGSPAPPTRQNDARQSVHPYPSYQSQDPRITHPQHDAQRLPNQYQTSIASTQQRHAPYGAGQTLAQNHTTHGFSGPHSKGTSQQIPDLLTDPFDIALSSTPVNGSAPPPIPPNPEKESLLQALSQTLAQQAQSKVTQTLSALAPLQAQQEAMNNAQARLKAELRHLEQISQTIESNERILHHSIQDCDQAVKSAKSKPAPPIDDILLAPTMVGQQLWALSAEEASIREAMYTLQKGVDHGRIGCEIFVKQMRTLGREAFLKMALARKCAEGLGLDSQR